MSIDKCWSIWTQMCLTHFHWRDSNFTNTDIRTTIMAYLFCMAIPALSTRLTIHACISAMQSGIWFRVLWVSPSAQELSLSCSLYFHPTCGTQCPADNWLHITVCDVINIHPASVFSRTHSWLLSMAWTTAGKSSRPYSKANCIILSWWTLCTAVFILLAPVWYSPRVCCRHMFYHAIHFNIRQQLADEGNAWNWLIIIHCVWIQLTIL